MDSFTIIVIACGSFLCGAVAMLALEYTCLRRIETTGTEFWPGEMR